MGIKMFRKRYIPNEVIDISNDEVLYMDDNVLVTKWLPIKPRKDIGRGLSFTFLKEGYKVSRFYDVNGDFAYWYCDIIDYRYDKIKDEHIFVDLLVDLRINLDGNYEILDLDELNEAYKDKLISKDEFVLAMDRLNKLLKLVKAGNFPPGICNDFLI